LIACNPLFPALLFAPQGRKSKNTHELHSRLFIAQLLHSDFLFQKSLKCMAVVSYRFFWEVMPVLRATLQHQ
jgi:hypothetical protein